MRNVLPKIKPYSLSIKLGLPGERTFKSSLCVTDFTVSSPNFVHSMSFDTQNDDISLTDHSALHLDHRPRGLIKNKVLRGDLYRLS